MSYSVNKVTLLGNLGKDPVLKCTANGLSICNVNLATEESFKDKSTSEIKKTTEWHNLIFFGKLAEVASKYLCKGSKIYVEGKLNTKKWTDKNGLDRWTTQIICGQLVMLGAKNFHDSIDKSYESNNNAQFDELDDDIPF